MEEIVCRQDVGVKVGKNVGINGNATEEKVLLLLQQDSRLTSKVLASTLGISQRQVERILKKLKETGRLVRHGSPKGGCWEVV
ncbi:MAG: winged helix-turn-helix transcriptional regulator [Acidaminococcaceae bacterium]|nr:winged helix-turn-helix transcriptional regulator [Acidaminococcaceae bacterium]